MKSKIIFITVACLLIVSGIYIYASNIFATHDVGSFSISLKPTASDALMVKLPSQIEALSGVTSVEYVSAGQQLEQFRKNHGDNKLVMDTLNLMDSQPFQSYINGTMLKSVDTKALSGEIFSLSPDIESIRYNIGDKQYLEQP